MVAYVIIIHTVVYVIIIPAVLHVIIIHTVLYVIIIHTVVYVITIYTGVYEIIISAVLNDFIIYTVVYEIIIPTLSCLIRFKPMVATCIHLINSPKDKTSRVEKQRKMKNKIYGSEWNTTHSVIFDAVWRWTTAFTWVTSFQQLPTDIIDSKASVLCAWSLIITENKTHLHYTPYDT